MENILTLFNNNQIMKSLYSKMEGLNYSLFCNGVTPHHSALIAASIYERFKEENKFVVYVCENIYLANKMYDYISNILGYEKVNLYVVDDIVVTESVIVNNELKQERINTIKSIINNEPTIIVTHIEALLKPVMSLERIKDNCILIKKGNEIDIQSLVKKLIELGYERVHTTYNLGEFSVRGEVLDIFPSCFDKPIRINFAFDEIENIRYFDLASQLTEKETMDIITIYPINEIIVSQGLDKLKEQLLNIDCKQFIEKDFLDIETMKMDGKITKYLKYIDPNYCIFTDYLRNCCVLFDDIYEIHKTYENLVYEYNEYYQDKKSLKIDYLFLEDINLLETSINNKIYLSNSKKGLPKLELLGIFEFHGYKTIDYQNDFKAFIEDIKTTTTKTYITFKEEQRLKLIEELLKENNIKYQIINNLNEDIKAIGLILCDNAISYGIFNQYQVITEEEIFRTTKKNRKYRSVKESSLYLERKDDLVVGDFVVHYDYGIGKYLGIKTVELNGEKNDYLQLQYENMQLLVPMEKIDLLEKYVGNEGVVPKLTKIGTNDWEKRKNNVRNQLENIAKDLIELQVKREQIKGYKYQSDSEFQKEFEKGFEYEPTNDQIKIIDEIKKEMEKGVLIDRLVCGDVGFGKTEIAMRIAFKTAYEGKQVAFMAPTTILSRQHYYSFIDRFSQFGIKIALLNRMIDPKIQKDIIKKVKNGEIDILIGTHRILNDEIVFKDLGLLIIDEEQRFGVVHKEKIKQMKNNINVLTLTATPIPRTLQMAVSGIRSLSLLETPPKHRYPIQTYVIEQNDKIIKDAIYRELARKGQVFYLHNRVSDIEQVVRKIKKLCPEARVCYGHGKMDRNELEDIISSYIDYQYDVFVCTTIIETGIDIPNTNTLIVDNANRLGLAQMYQIRGRVGRTDRIAYAYFMHPSDKVLNGTSEKRLGAIKEFTKIGSGYKIAVRDLAIRGAGDILGVEQSGFINSIGIDMYMKLLNEAIDKSKGIEKEEKINYKIDVSKHIEKEYVDDDAIIIYIHKEINKIESYEDKQNTIAELQNRFGKLSDNVISYIEERYLESYLRKYKINKVAVAPNLVTIIIPKNVSDTIRGEEIMMAGYKTSDNFSFEYRSGQYVIKYKKEENSKEWIFTMTSFFEKLCIKTEK